MDSDDESDEISQLSAQTTDPLRDSLGKKPSDRTPHDVEVGRFSLSFFSFVYKQLLVFTRFSWCEYNDLKTSMYYVDVLCRCVMSIDFFQ